MLGLSRFERARPGRRRRWSAVVAAATLVSGLAGSAAPAEARSSKRYLVVSDTAEERLYVYRVPEMRLTGELRNIRLGAHAGTLLLPDGRLVFGNDAASEIVAMKIDQKGRPRIVNRVDADLGDGSIWGGADPKFRYFALSSDVPGTDQQFVNVVNLKTFENTSVRLTANEELHPYLAGDPLHLYVGVGAEIQGYRLSDLLKGAPIAPDSTTAVGAGSHGPVNSPKTGTIAITTAAGLEVVPLECDDDDDDDCSTLGTADIVPWAADGLAGGQNFRPRLARDGRTALGAITVSATDQTQWAGQPTDVHAVNLAERTARRVPLGAGISSRFTASNSDEAAFALIDPNGDRLRVLDTDDLSLDGEALLEPLGNGPVAGVNPAGTERRAVGITPDGDYAFASHGGDGKISMVDTDDFSVEVFTVPSPLTGGGYVVGYQSGVRSVDLMTR